MDSYSPTLFSLTHNTSYQTGLVGEYTVADLMRDRGFRVLAHRARTRWGEIDLVLRRGDLVVFAEVKTARPTRLLPELAVGRRSQQRLRRAAIAWMATNAALHQGARRYRFDVMIVRCESDGDISGIEHLRNAF